MQGQMQRRLQLQLKQSHAALAQERLQTVRAKKLGDHALAQAERSQEQALEQARVQREAAEKRLARQMGAQRSPRPRDGVPSSSGSARRMSNCGRRMRSSSAQGTGCAAAFASTAG